MITQSQLQQIPSLLVFYCYKVAAISWMVPLYIALITHSPNTPLKSRHAMAFGAVVWIRYRAGKQIHPWCLRRITETEVADLHVPPHHPPVWMITGSFFVITVRALNRKLSVFLFWNYPVNEVKSPKRLILCLLLIFQKPVIQLCLFICSLWANNYWSAAMQSRCVKYWNMSLCMLHSNHLWCL